MFGMGWPELLVVGLVGFFVFGPERLPGVAKDAARLINQLRTMAQGAADDLKQHVPDGKDYGLDDLRELRDLHPKRMMSKAFFEDPSPALATVTMTPAARAASADANHVPRYDIDAT